MRIHFITPHGTAIVGHLRQSAPTERLLIVCHGFKSSQKHPAIQQISDGLYKKGWAVLTFNFSDNELGFDLARQVNDLMALIDHLNEYNEIFLLAGSFGALSTAIAATKSRKIKGLVTLNGFFGQGKLRASLRRVFIGFHLLAAVHPRYRTIWRYYKQQFKPTHVTIPTLVIHALHDKNVDIAQSRWFYAQLPGNKKFVELPRSDHELTTGNEIGFVVKTIHEWVRTIE